MLPGHCKQPGFCGPAQLLRPRPRIGACSHPVRQHCQQQRRPQQVAAHLGRAHTERALTGTTQAAGAWPDHAHACSTDAGAQGRALVPRSSSRAPLLCRRAAQRPSGRMRTSSCATSATSWSSPCGAMLTPRCARLRLLHKAPLGCTLHPPDVRNATWQPALQGAVRGCLETAACLRQGSSGALLAAIKQLCRRYSPQDEDGSAA